MNEGSVQCIWCNRQATINVTAKTRLLFKLLWIVSQTQARSVPHAKAGPKEWPTWSWSKQEQGYKIDGQNLKDPIPLQRTVSGGIKAYAPNPPWLFPSIAVIYWFSLPQFCSAGLWWKQNLPPHNSNSRNIFLLIFYFFLNDDYWLIAVSYPKPKVKDADLLPQCQHVACLKF